MLDYNKVASKLYQGSMPDGRHSYRPFSVIVLCAQEVQPRLRRFEGLILRPAFDDSPWPTARELRRAESAARRVVEALRRDQRVLVTCAAGRNRSGLVIGLALRMGTRLPASEVIRRIRRARGPNALSNPAFEEVVRRYRRGCNIRRLAA